MAKWVFLNNDFVKEEKSFLHFRDLSFQRGYGIFDFFRLVGNKPLFLTHHLDRFFFSASEMHLLVPFDRAQLKAIISNLIEKNNLPESGIRLSLTGGYSEDGFRLGKSNFLISQHQFAPPTDEQRKAGIKLVSYPYQRQLPQVKTIDYLMAIWLQPLRIDNKADDILYYQNGMVSECPRSNFFLVTSDGKIATPSENVLKGITRNKLLEIASKHYHVEERRVSIDEIKSAREAFTTSTTKQILPICQIDDIIFENHNISNELLRLFRDYCSTQ